MWHKLPSQYLPVFSMELFMQTRSHINRLILLKWLRWLESANFIYANINALALDQKDRHDALIA